jgi:DNA-binding PadR family transcriptional regulator
MAVNSDILRGHTDTIILRILSEGDSYGYEVAKRIIEDGEGYIDIKDATIYIAFKRMEENRLITTYWGEGVEGARRKYYKITQKGLEVYNNAVKEWKEVNRILNKLLIGGKESCCSIGSGNIWTSSSSPCPIAKRPTTSARSF